MYHDRNWSALKRELTGVCLATALGGMLRLWRLDLKGFWYDEFCAWYSFSSGDLLTTLKNVPDVHSPGLALIMMTLRKFFPLTDDCSARMLPALLGVASIPLLFYIGKRAFGTRIGLIAAFILAIAPIHIELSRQLVMYSLELDCVLAAIFFLYLATALGTAKCWGAAAFFMACSLYSHPFCVFPLAMVTLGLAIDGLVFERAYRRLGAFALAWAGAALAYAPWLIYRVKLGRFSGALYASENLKPETMSLYDRFRQIVALIWQGDDGSGTLNAPLCLLIVLLLAGSLLSFRRRRREMMMTVSWALTPLAIHGLCSLYGYPAYSRYLLAGVPAIALLLVLGFFGILERTDRIPWLRNPVRIALVLGVIWLLLWNTSVLACQFMAPQLPGFRPLAQTIDREAEDDAQVVVTAFESYASHVSHDFVERYAPALRDRVYVENRNRPHAHTEALLNKGHTVWYVVYHHIPAKTQEWLKTRPSVHTVVVGGYPMFAVLMIPEGAFPNVADRDRFIDHVQATELEAYRNNPVRVMIRAGQRAEARYGSQSPQSRACYEKALQQFAPLRRIAPYSSYSRSTCGEILEKLGRYDDASREYRAAAALEFGNDKENLIKSIARTVQKAEASRRAHSAKPGAAPAGQ